MEIIYLNVYNSISRMSVSRVAMTSQTISWKMRIISRPEVPQKGPRLTLSFGNIVPQKRYLFLERSLAYIARRNRETIPASVTTDVIPLPVNDRAIRTACVK
jgi:hypothetical protein